MKTIICTLPMPTKKANSSCEWFDIRRETTRFWSQKFWSRRFQAASLHAGTRVRFGPDEKLYITTGDAGKRELAQELDSLSGKTLRFNDDGSVPQDNPFVGRSNARPEIWSYGHRNSQGIAWQPGSDLMFQTEHGPTGFDGPGGGDEVNIVERDENYGWPIIHHRESKAGMHSPLLEYTPAVAPASALFYTGKMFPQYQGNFFFGCLRGERIIRVVLDGQKVIQQESLLQNKYGRIRDVEQGPDGAIYFSTSNQDGRGNHLKRMIVSFDLFLTSRSLGSFIAADRVCYPPLLSSRSCCAQLLL
jgi:glucose/arabinose dehydrogenase